MENVLYYSREREAAELQHENTVSSKSLLKILQDQPVVHLTYGGCSNVLCTAEITSEAIGYCYCLSFYLHDFHKRL